MRLVVTSNAQEREVARFRERNAAFVRALMSMQRLTYLSGGLPGPDSRRRHRRGVRLRRPPRDSRRHHRRHLRRVHGVPDALPAAAAGADGAVREPGDRARVAAPRVAQILDEPVEVQERAAAPSRCRRCAATSTFEDVTLSFDRGAPVLEQLSFSVRAGEVLAIVGPSGSGKSTIADLLLRLLDPDSGRRAPRRPRSAHRAARRPAPPRRARRSGAVSCSTRRSPRTSATRGPTRPTPRCAAAARQAALDELHRAAAATAIETIVGERGTALSAGERQRIAIGARVPGEPVGPDPRRADGGARSRRPSARSPRATRR